MAKNISKKIVVTSPPGYAWVGSNDNLSKEVKLNFKKRSKLGNLLKMKKEIVKKIPESMKVKSIENNVPSVGKITIFLQRK